MHDKTMKNKNEATERIPTIALRIEPAELILVPSPRKRKATRDLSMNPSKSERSPANRLPGREFPHSRRSPY